MNNALTPSISVILPTRDRPVLLAGCLACLQANDYPQREIIIVDQSQDDETATVVRHAAALDDSLRYVRSGAVGSSRAQNIALALARGEVVAMTNDDCLPATDWLERIAAEFTADPEVVAVFGPFLPLGLSPRTVPVAALTGRRRWTPRSPHQVWRLGYGGNMAFRLEAVLAVGGWDEMLGPGSPRGWGCNDVDLIYRVLRRGGRAVYDPSIIVWHMQQHNLRQALRREAAYARGAGAIVAKLLRCGDRSGWHLLAQRLWPLGAGRNWQELLESLDGGRWWTTTVRALYRMCCLVALIPLGLYAGWRQPLQDHERTLYQNSLTSPAVCGPRSA